VVISVVVIFVRTFIVAPFQISGSSMEESYHDGEFILVNKFSYVDTSFERAKEDGYEGKGAWNMAIGAKILNLVISVIPTIKVGDPVRGDVVILRPHAANGKEYYIKRVVAMPGDFIKFEWGNVFLKLVGKTDYIQLNEDYLSLNNKGKTFLPMDVKETEFIVPEGQYFTMWDNRNNSSDSRSCFMSCSVQGSTHFVSRENIVGKLFIDFGYINIFREWGVRTTGEWKWTHPPRLLATPKDWVYSELQ
jgi:signal peptidase I